MADERPITDGRRPSDVVNEMVERVLVLARTWPSWDGVPRPAGDREYTPHKAIRRVTDHMIDHLADLDMRRSGLPTMEDRWHASAITTPSDMAPFTTQDVDEAESRLVRLAKVWALRLEGLTEEQLDTADGDTWTPREVAFHLAESVYYAQSVGDL